MDTSGRAVTGVLGIVLLFGFIMVSAVGVVVIGSAALDSVSSDAHVEQEEQRLTQFSSDIRSTRNDEFTRSSLDVSGSSSTKIDTNQMRVNITKEHPNGTETTDNYTLGTLVHEIDDTQFIYEGGAVFRSGTDTSHATVQSGTDIEYRDSTLHFPLYNLTDDGSASGDQLSFQSQRHTSTASPVINLTVEIHSDYYRAWESYLADEVGSDNVTTGDDTVVVELKSNTTDPDPDPNPGSGSPSDLPIDYALAGGGGLSIASGDIGDAVIARGSVDIQKSTVEGDLDAWGDIDLNDAAVEGAVHGDGDVTVNDGSVDGAIHAQNGGIDLSDVVVGDEIRGDSAVSINDGTVAGDVQSLNGNINFNDVDVTGEVRSKDGLDVVGGSIGDDVYAQNGGVSLDDVDTSGALYSMSDIDADSGSISGPIHAQNSQVDLQDVTVSESVYAAQGITIDGGSVDGELHAQNGPVELDGTTVTGPVYATSNVKANDVSIDGDLHVQNGEVTLNGGTVDGDAYVSGQIVCNDVTIGGEIYVSSGTNVQDCDAPTDSLGDEDGPDSPDSQVGQIGQEAPESPDQMPRHSVSSPGFDSNDNEQIPDDQDIIGTDSGNNGNGNNGNGGDETEDSDKVVVSAGQYELDRIDVDDGETLVFDTSEGPIDIVYSAAQGHDEILISEGSEVIIDDDGTGNEVNLYVEPASNVPLRVDEGSVTTRPEPDQANLLNFKSMKQRDFYLHGNGDEEFTGTIIAPETNQNVELTDMTLVGGIHAPKADVTIDVNDGYAIKMPGQESADSNPSDGSDGTNGGTNGSPDDSDAYYVVNTVEYGLSIDE